MKPRIWGLGLVAFWIAVLLPPAARAQSQQPDENQAAPPPAPQGGAEGLPRGPQARGRGVFGKISALGSDSIEVARPDGSKISLKVTASTEFRKEREPAKISDFKVGDLVMIRTDQESATALVVSAAPQGFVGRAGMPAGMPGTMGKDFVAGEVSSVDPPRLTIIRVDKVQQTIELTEETSLRRGRDSITMAEIHPGDHIFARGSVANDAFVPKSLNVILPEQWKRWQEMNAEGGAKGAPLHVVPPPPAAQAPPEQPN